jgi:hypothetical protein
MEPRLRPGTSEQLRRQIADLENPAHPRQPDTARSLRKALIKHHVLKLTRWLTTGPYVSTSADLSLRNLERLQQCINDVGAKALLRHLEPHALTDVSRRALRAHLLQAGCHCRVLARFDPGAAAAADAMQPEAVVQCWSPLRPAASPHRVIEQRS